jgi:hypothetical protein
LAFLHIHEIYHSSAFYDHQRLVWKTSCQWLTSISDAIKVQGTPASGKTLLAKLLTWHIKETELNTSVINIAAWPTKAEMPAGGYVEWLATENWTFQENAVLIVDEAQKSYWDNKFWNDIKAIDHSSHYRVITFTRYGSTGIKDSIIALDISLDRIVDLERVQSGDNASLGLRLTKEEFDECVTFKFEGHRFDASFLNVVFEFTDGHVGACLDLLEFTMSHDVSLSAYSETENYS